MEFIDKLKFSSVCGIYCETECIIYKAYSANNEAKRRQLAHVLLKDMNRWAEIRCDGCKGEQAISWYKDCPIKKCAYSRGYEFCIECHDYPCQLLKKQQHKNEKIKKSDLAQTEKIYYGF